MLIRMADIKLCSLMRDEANIAARCRQFSRMVFSTGEGVPGPARAMRSFWSVIIFAFEIVYIFIDPNLDGQGKKPQSKYNCN